MTWDSIQQILRIVLNAGGAALLGNSVAQGELYQAAVGGALSIGAFVWWMVYQSSKPAE